MANLKIVTVAELPEELGNAWLQHLRDFDTANPGCHFQVVTDAPQMDMDKVIEMLRVQPELSFQEVFKREFTKK